MHCCLAELGKLQFKFGPDLAGGITLIYELQDTAETGATTPNQPPGPNKPTALSNSRAAAANSRCRKLIDSLKRRLDPDGTKEITIREYGPARRNHHSAGRPGRDGVREGKDHEDGATGVSHYGRSQHLQGQDRSSKRRSWCPPTKQEVRLGDQLVAKWVPYDVKEFGPVDQPNGYVKRMAGDTPEMLVLIDTFNVTGDYLTSATKGIDEHGRPAVHFAFNTAGAQRFDGLRVRTRRTRRRRTSIGTWASCSTAGWSTRPTIRTKISDRGMISGGSMTDREVELIVQVLDAGSLPAALNKTPISEEIISPTLGGQTVDKGKRAIARVAGWRHGVHDRLLPVCRRRGLHRADVQPADGAGADGA